MSTESLPSNVVVNLPALKASVADGGRVMLGIVRGLMSTKYLLMMSKGPVTNQLLYGNSTVNSVAWLLLPCHCHVKVKGS